MHPLVLDTCQPFFHRRSPAQQLAVVNSSLVERERHCELLVAVDAEDRALTARLEAHQHVRLNTPREAVGSLERGIGRALFANNHA